MGRSAYEDRTLERDCGKEFTPNFDSAEGPLVTTAGILLNNQTPENKRGQPEWRSKVLVQVSCVHAGRTYTATSDSRSDAIEKIVRRIARGEED